MAKKQILDMSLKSVFFEPICLGVKKVEYREMTDYWAGKLLDLEKYGGKNVFEVIDGLMHGTLDVIPRGWTHILFHQSGGSRTLLVEMGDIKTYKGHRAFCISLGKVIEQKWGGENTPTE